MRRSSRTHGVQGRADRAFIRIFLGGLSRTAGFWEETDESRIRRRRRDESGYRARNRPPGDRVCRAVHLTLAKGTMSISTIMSHSERSTKDPCRRALSNLRSQSVTPETLAKSCEKHGWRCVRLNDGASPAFSRRSWRTLAFTSFLCLPRSPSQES